MLHFAVESGLGIYCAWFVLWWYKRNYLPGNNKDEIGLVICIVTENDRQKNILKNDFVFRLRELINKQNLKRRINLSLFSNYQAESTISVFEDYANNKDNLSLGKRWQTIQKRTGSHFFLYGRIKERLDGEKTYYLDLQAMVVHAPMPLDKNKEFNVDISSAWCKQISFKESFEFKGFQFAADTIFIAVQYIVGQAALVSGDLYLALELHTNLDSSPYFSATYKIPKNLSYVKEKLMTLRAAESFLIARCLYWKGDLINSKKYMDMSLAIAPSYGAYLLKSIMEYVCANDAETALETVRKAKVYAKDNGTWRYNEGFLLMCLDRFEEALNVYEGIVSSSYPGEDATLMEVYDFNENILRNHPEKIQSHFVIGYLKQEKDYNHPDALEHLEAFLRKSNGQEKYKVLGKVASDMCKRIKSEMSLAEQVI